MKSLVWQAGVGEKRKSSGMDEEGQPGQPAADAALPAKHVDESGASLCLRCLDTMAATGCPR